MVCFRKDLVSQVMEASNRMKIPLQKWWRGCRLRVERIEQAKDRKIGKKKKTTLPVSTIVGTKSYLLLCLLVMSYGDNKLIQYISVSSVQFSHSVVSNSFRPRESQHTRPPCPSPTPRVHSDSHPSSQWCHPVISSSVVPFSSCPQSLPSSESFPMSQLFTSGGQSTGVSASASFLPKKSQGWSPSEWTGSISLQSKGLSRVFSSTTVQKHQFFGAQLSSQSNSHIHTWPLEKP